jgi:S1-C subfamily serine protease
VRIARLRASDVVTLRVRRHDDVQDVRLSAVPIAHRPSGRPALGLALRSRRGVGSEVVAVEPGSAADRAGLTAGDVITLFAETTAPSEAQIARAFAALPERGGVMVAFTREDAHHVTVVER